VIKPAPELETPLSNISGGGLLSDLLVSNANIRIRYPKCDNANIPYSTDYKRSVFKCSGNRKRTAITRLQRETSVGTAKRWLPPATVTCAAVQISGSRTAFNYYFGFLQFRFSFVRRLLACCIHQLNAADPTPKTQNRRIQIHKKKCCRKTRHFGNNTQIL
jgi:hypothetical protein